MGPSIPKLRDPSTYAHTIWPRVTKFGKVTQVGQHCVSRSQPRPHCKGAVSQHAQKFSTLLDTQTVWARANEFDVVTCGKSVFVFLRGTAKPFSQGGGVPAPPKFLGPPTCVHTVWETTTRFCMVLKLDVRISFTWFTTNSEMRSVCGS